MHPWAVLLTTLLCFNGAAGYENSGDSKRLMRRETRQTLAMPTDLQSALQEILDDAPAQRLLAVETSVRESYEAFVKDSAGHIPFKGIFPAMVRDYFAKSHGWLLRGLEPPTLSSHDTQVFEAHILAENAPRLVNALQNARNQKIGLSMSDVVNTISAVEHLLLNESSAVLRGAYFLNGKAPSDILAEADLDEILTSYLLLFRLGSQRNLTDVKLHSKAKARAKTNEEMWSDVVEFAEDAKVRTGHREKVSFDQVKEIVVDLALSYGRWQNKECDQMKASLTALDTEGQGAVLLSSFHTQPNHSAFTFSEPADYLRRVGALDESKTGTPKVLIANYLLAPSNCIASSQYYSVCCLNECGQLHDELEGRVKKPAAPPQELIAAASGVSSSTVTAPRKLAETLFTELNTISDTNAGTVPLHSPAFRHWMHHAFPHECPLPTAADDAAEASEQKAAQDWMTDMHQQCTRVQEWQHTGVQEEVLNV